MNFLSITDGQFDLRVADQHHLVDEPEQLMQLMQDLGCDGFGCSGSVDFPEEHGMSAAKAQRFFALLDAEEQRQERLVERCLTPLIYRVQLASQLVGSTWYERDRPCQAARWDTKGNRWHLQLHSLTCLQDLQKEVGCAVQLLDGMLTIQDEA